MYLLMPKRQPVQALDNLQIMLSECTYTKVIASQIRKHSTCTYFFYVETRNMHVKTLHKFTIKPGFTIAHTLNFRTLPAHCTPGACLLKTNIT
jgi:hypothetical protein